ncbi:MAG: 50S ribosomal protein L3 [Euryarchaeota archaeon]|nr:50S ribosomal protein L3 [Euryarchaeota archaeon]
MPKSSRPRRGSMGYSPRKRARDHIARFSSWPETDDGPKLQGFAGYKVGMTHAFIVDYRPHSNTSGQEVQVPVTVLEVPPMKVTAVRVYECGPYGLSSVGEMWNPKIDDDVRKRLPMPKTIDNTEARAKLEGSSAEEVRVIMCTQPKLITGVPKKVPDIMEIRVGGGAFKDRLGYAISLLGKEISVRDYAREGMMVDVASITRGKGFQGHTKRWGVKLLSHKNSKHRRMIGTLGPKFPKYVRPTVPQAGQTGYHQRTEYNKRVLKIGGKEENITPDGGFLHYGVVRNDYMVIHGSLPGPSKRLIGLRDPIRPIFVKVSEPPKLAHISTQSKQG